MHRDYKYSNCGVNIFKPDVFRIARLGAGRSAFADTATTSQDNLALARAMRKQDLEVMDFEELWLLHEELTKILAEKITAEKLELEKRLAQLNRPEPVQKPESSLVEAALPQRPRRKYPKVVPKYYNPMEPTETWSGRGKQPRWLVAALQAGHTLDEFRIPENKDQAGPASSSGG